MSRSRPPSRFWVAAVVIAAGASASTAGAQGDGAFQTVGIEGCWRGDVFEAGIGDYPLVLEVAPGEQSGLVTFLYPNQDCVAVLTRIEGGSGTTALFSERLIEGINVCVDDLQARVTLRDGGGEVLFEEMQFGEAVVTGELRPMLRDGEGRCRIAPELLS